MVEACTNNFLSSRNVHFIPSLLQLLVIVGYALSLVCRHTKISDNFNAN